MHIVNFGVYEIIQNVWAEMMRCFSLVFVIAFIGLSYGTEEVSLNF